MTANTLKWMLAATAVLAFAVASVVAWSHITVGVEIFTALAEASTVAADMLGLPRRLFQPIVIVATVFFTAQVVAFLANLLIGRVQVLPTVLVGVLFTASIAGWLLVSRDWLYGLKGEPLVYVCPPEYAGANVRVQRYPADHALGGLCEPVSRTTAEYILARRNATPIDPVILTNGVDPRGFARFDVEGPILLTGAPASPGDPPSLYRGRVGIDPVTNKLLRPTTSEDLALVAAGMERTREADNEAVQILATSRENEEKKALRSALRKEVADLRTRVNALRQEAVLQEAAKRSALAQSSGLHAAATTTSPESSIHEWQRYFVHDLDGQTPLVLIVGEASAEMKRSISSQLSGGQWWGEDVLQNRQFIQRVATPLLDVPNVAINPKAFPPSVNQIVVAKLNYQMATGRWCVSIARFDVRKWTVRKYSQAIEI